MVSYVPRLGDLIVVKGLTWIGIEIESITKSEYSHVAGVVKPNELIEAAGFRKTGYQGLDYYQGMADIFICPSITDEQRGIIVDYAIQQVGGRYDYLLILWEAVRYVTHVLLPYKEMKSRICSTLWSDAYLAAGIDLCPGIKYPSPADLAVSKSLIKIAPL
ncbi:hypothetical protein [Heyndrickxia acidicola]|uniref:Uncharacterized protein n=1 Tax=Heyndrickxia acidicola TaxID=209389 RepID=A0ABU6ML05_9BACI|nr:hypothetical protein [Heyndrickxia acidicola]MED1205038.1 hypothetical protein [Heyndrickxia acidicola]